MKQRTNETNVKCDGIKIVEKGCGERTGRNANKCRVQAAKDPLLLPYSPA